MQNSLCEHAVLEAVAARTRMNTEHFRRHMAIHWMCTSRERHRKPSFTSWVKNHPSPSRWDLSMVWACQVSSSISPHFMFWDAISLPLELADSARLFDQWAPGTCHLHLRLEVWTAVSGFYHMCLGTNSGPQPCMTASSQPLKGPLSNVLCIFLLTNILKTKTYKRNYKTLRFKSNVSKIPNKEERTPEISSSLGRQQSNSVKQSLT